VIEVRCPNCDSRTSWGGSPRRARTSGSAARGAGPFSRAAARRESGPGGVESAGARARRVVKDPELARRLARAMVSEILLNASSGNGEVDPSAALSRYGSAIASAFAMYEERVSPDLPSGKQIFREAVNDLLGRGRRLL